MFRGMGHDSVMIEGEGRGEKAYNCNWITIKNKLKKKKCKLDI